MKINYNVSSNTFTEKDYNVDTVYIRYDAKYYKVIDHETREKEEISKEEFDKLDTNEREVNYTEEQYTYREFIEKLEREEIEKQARELDAQVKKDVEMDTATSNFELMGMVMLLQAEIDALKEDK